MRHIGNFHLRAIYFFSHTQWKHPPHLLPHSKSPNTNCNKTISSQQPVPSRLILLHACSKKHTMVVYERGDQLPWGSYKDAACQGLEVNRKAVPEKQR